MNTHGGDVQKYLEGIEFPCSKEDVIQKLRDNGADESLIEKVQNSGMDTFNSLAEIEAMSDTSSSVKKESTNGSDMASDDEEET